MMLIGLKVFWFDILFFKYRHSQGNSVPVGFSDYFNAILAFFDEKISQNKTSWREIGLFMTLQ
jgi:hypothetical protein